MKKIIDAIKNLSDEPWARFESGGVNTDGLIKWDMMWNNAFIKNLRAAGFEGLTEEDLVEQFFLMSQMRPDQYVVNPSGLPHLSTEADTLNNKHVLRK